MPSRLSLIRYLALSFFLVPGLVEGADDKKKDKREENKQEEPFSRAPYLQLSTPNSIYVVWRTGKPMTPIVKFGLSPEKLDRFVDGSAIEQRRTEKDEERFLKDTGKKIDKTRILFNAPENTIQFEAAITGLEPDTRYYYAVFDGKKRLTPEDPSYYFKTHPNRMEKADVYLWVVGDSGTGEKRQRKVHEAMIDYNKATARELDLYLHVGDMAYDNGKDEEFTKKYFNMYEPTLRNTVCFPAMGNHEGGTSKGLTGIGPYYDCYVCPWMGEAGGLPSGTEAYYSFDYGKVHFIVLDSFDIDRSPNASMARWLKADLESTQADWLIAYWHHPPYTLGSHNSNTEMELIEMRENIMPILEAGGVDLVLTGHSHIYERSMLIDGAYQTPTVADGVILDDGDGDPRGSGAYRKSAGLNPNEGNIQVVTGHGGKGVSRLGTIPLMKRIYKENGSTMIRIRDNTLALMMINYKGEQRDYFQLKKEGKVTVSRIEDPWTPEPYKSKTLKKREEEAKKKKAEEEKKKREEERKKKAEAEKKAKESEKLPKEYTEIIKKNAEWRYLADGEHAPEGWTKPGFDASKWKKGKAGFGYADDDDETILDNMRKKYTTVYVLNTFEIKDDADRERVGLAIDYDDAFIAYVNGKEVLRVGVKEGRGKDAKDITNTQNVERSYINFPLAKWKDVMKKGKNTIAIEGHNMGKDSSDFSLNPFILLEKKK